MTEHGRGTDRGSTTARIYCPWAGACWCGFRVTSGWCLPAVSLIYYSAFPQDLQISHWVQEPWLFPELFLTFSEECLCIDLCSLCWTNCLEGTSQFLMHGCFFRYSIFRYLDISDINFAKDISAKVTSILDIGEEFVKNIVLSMIDHCNRLYYTWNPLNFIILFHFYFLSSLCTIQYLEIFLSELYYHTVGAERLERQDLMWLCFKS